MPLENNCINYTVCHTFQKCISNKAVVNQFPVTGVNIMFPVLPFMGLQMFPTISFNSVFNVSEYLTTVKFRVTSLEQLSEAEFSGE